MKLQRLNCFRHEYFTISHPISLMIIIGYCVWNTTARLDKTQNVSVAQFCRPTVLSKTLKPTLAVS